MILMDSSTVAITPLISKTRASFLGCDTDAMNALATSPACSQDTGPINGMVYDCFIAAARIATVVFELMPWSRPTP